MWTPAPAKFWEGGELSLGNCVVEVEQEAQWEVFFGAGELGSAGECCGVVSGWYIVSGIEV